MYLKRKIDTYLAEWKQESGHKPLIVKGARQIGKTESILNFAKSNYDNIVYINFALEKKYFSITNEGYEEIDVVKNISLVDPSKNFIPNKTIIIFDEIQDFPDIATTLKSFNINKNYDVICSGSLLGLHYKKIHSNSVGNKTDYVMQSMDFEEYLWACGYNDLYTGLIYNHMMRTKPFSSTVFSHLNKLFLDYCVIGGMPEIVKSYVVNNNFSDTLTMQKQILLDYEEDARKYASGLDQAKIISVLRSVPYQLAKENKSFQYKQVRKNARSRDFVGCIDWLVDSGIINKCNCLNYPELPLGGNADTSKFKLYFADTGLLISTLDEESQVDLRANKNLGVYKGALYENFVAEALTKQGYDLYYYKKQNSTLEEDFFVRKTNNLVPVEVKAGRSDAPSLRALINNENYPDIEFGIKLSCNNIGVVNDVYTFPYFCAFQIKRYLQDSN